MRRRSITGYLIGSSLLPILERTGVVTAGLCCLLVAKTLADARSATLRAMPTARISFPIFVVCRWKPRIRSCATGETSIARATARWLHPHGLLANRAQSLLRLI